MFVVVGEDIHVCTVIAKSFGNTLKLVDWQFEVFNNEIPLLAQQVHF